MMFKEGSLKVEIIFEEYFYIELRGKKIDLYMISKSGFRWLIEITG